MKRHLARIGYYISRHRVRRLMHKMGITAIYQKPKTTNRNATHKVYPYLLRGLKSIGKTKFGALILLIYHSKKASCI
ncbi:unnamed protein product [Ectocarpus sp. 12 AP-2014]